MLLGQISAHFQSWSELWFGKHMGTCVKSKYFNKPASVLSCPGRSWELGHRGDALQLTYLLFPHKQRMQKLGAHRWNQRSFKGIEHHNSVLLSASGLFVFASPFLLAKQVPDTMFSSPWAQADASSNKRIGKLNSCFEIALFTKKLDLLDPFTKTGKVFCCSWGLNACSHSVCKYTLKKVSIAVSEQLKHRCEAVSCTAMSWAENVLLIATDTYNYTTDLCEHEVAKELNILLLPRLASIEKIPSHWMKYIKT